MAEFRSFAGGGRPVLIEVGEGGGGRSGSLTELFAVVADIAAAYGDAVARMPSRSKPSELQVSFGMRALADGSVGVALDASKANFQVTMTWAGEGSAAQMTSALAKPPEAPQS